MLIIDLCIQGVFLISIFDIYFTSPLVRNVPAYQPQHHATTKRLTLFIIDALRAESFVDRNTMTYLRSIASTHGRWGTSLARAPTVSRPCHIAIMAGFYEDPSAIFKGWKENPVDFDSVLNKTRHSWCWGTSDIIDIFSKGSGDHITAYKANAYRKGMSSDKNTTLFDSWVIESVKSFFKNAKQDAVLKRKLNEDKIVFFVHFIGADFSGHLHRPNSKPFLTSLRFIDEGIKEIEEIVREFYKDDGKTTFLVTSDHGMTDWGSHGGAATHEALTPYVLWGAGVRRSSETITEPGMLPVDNRVDVEQADLAPLMATILSIPVPVNSIGKLPYKLLSLSLPNKAKAMYSNCRQLASQYDKKRSDVESKAISVLFQPYKAFNKQRYNETIEHAEKLLKEAKYSELILLSEEIMDLSLSGLQYYNNYYQFCLLVIVPVAFVGWITCLLFSLLNRLNQTATRRNNLGTNFLIIVFVFACLTSAVLVYVQNLPVQYNMYLLLPVTLWLYALSSPGLWIDYFRHLNWKQTGKLSIASVFFTSGCLCVGLSFTNRNVLSIPLVGLALWPFLSSARSRLPKPFLFAWLISCSLICAFTFMPVVGKQVFIELVLLAGLIWSVGFVICIWKILWPLYRSGKESRTEILLPILQTALLMMALQNIYVQSERHERATSVSYLYQSTAWMIAVISLSLPLMHSKRMLCRLLAIDMSIITFYLLLSVAHEGLFLVTLFFNSLCWVFIEFTLVQSDNVKILDCIFDEEIKAPNSTDYSIPTGHRSTSLQDFRRAFFFSLYIVIAFFGTGNIPSLNSFEIRWVTCFVTSHKPFLITTMILLKTLTPFLGLACSFNAVQHLTKAPTGSLQTIVLIYSNITGIQLLYRVKNTDASYEEIYQTILHFIICQVFTLFVILINQVARVLTGVNLYNVVVKCMSSGENNEQEVFRSEDIVVPQAVTA